MENKTAIVVYDEIDSPLSMDEHKRRVEACAAEVKRAMQRNGQHIFIGGTAIVPCPDFLRKAADIDEHES